MGDEFDEEEWKDAGKKYSPADWLSERYSYGDETGEFSEADIAAAGKMVQAMMQYRPEHRPSVNELLGHSWMQRNPCVK